MIHCGRVGRLSLIQIVATSAICSFAVIASAQTTDDTTPRAIDDCGVLVRGTDCVLFEGGGGSWYIADYGNFRVGDVVRVVGTADPTCITICRDADGCVRGAVLYDPAVYPCGTPIPSLDDLGGAVVDSICTAASGALATTALVGMFVTRSGRYNPRRAKR